MCTWAPTPRVYATFARVFPHVIEAAGGAVLIGSRQPLYLDVASWSSRLAEVEAYLGHNRVLAVGSWLDRCTLSIDAPKLSPNQDLFPRDEFAAP